MFQLANYGKLLQNLYIKIQIHFFLISLLMRILLTVHKKIILWVALFIIITIIDKLLEHCKLIESTAEWGGEQEVLNHSYFKIVAISEYFQIPIWLYQATCPLLKFGDDHNTITNPPLLLS